MYGLGEGWGLAPEGCNPCRSIEKFPERSRERFLTDAEFARLGQVLDEAVAGSPTAVAVIPLATMTAGRVVNLYDLMDAAYDATEIHAVSQRLGHVPVIDINPRRDKALKEAR